MSTALIRRLLFGISFVLMLVACGQKGPLVLPEPAPTQSSSSAPDSNSTTETQ